MNLCTIKEDMSVRSIEKPVENRSLIYKNLRFFRFLGIVGIILCITYPAISQANLCDIFVQARSKITTWRLTRALEKQNALPREINKHIARYKHLEKLESEYERQKELAGEINDKQKVAQIIDSKGIDEKLTKLTAEMHKINTVLTSFYKNNNDYADVGTYSEGRAWVQDKQGNCFHIDLEGKRLYPKDYAFAGTYSEGRARVRDKQGNEFQIDLAGKRL